MFLNVSAFYPLIQVSYNYYIFTWEGKSENLSNYSAFGLVILMDSDPELFGNSCNRVVNIGQSEVRALLGKQNNNF